MRKIILSFLLATTVATPALAQRNRSDDGNERAERRSERAEARQQRSEARQQARQERMDARQQSRPESFENRQQQVRTERFENRQQSGGERAFTVRQMEVERSNEARADRDSAPRSVDVRRTLRRVERSNASEDGRPTLDRANGDSVANWRKVERDDARDRRMVERTERRLTPPVGARPDRPAPAPETESRRDRHPEWRTDWRRDHRYDWRRWRDRHRSHFRIGFYYDPFGWGYHRYGIGWRLWPSYYSSRYWLNDPWSYRLPYAPWPYRWVRYYDDALLVNTISGRVVDVIYDFFW